MQCPPVPPTALCYSLRQMMLLSVGPLAFVYPIVLTCAVCHNHEQAVVVSIETSVHATIADQDS
jgi:hypothetical protein